MQSIDAIEVNDNEAAAIAAHVKRLQDAGEPELTASALLARMTHKIVRGWADQVVEAQTNDQLRTIETKLREVPAADRDALVEQLVSAIEAAAPAIDATELLS